MEAPVKETHALTEDEVVRVLAEIPDADRPLITFLAQTGVRISEALPLTKADVDFKRGRVQIVKRLYRGGVGAPKSAYGVRKVPLSPALAETLKSRLESAPDHALVFPAVDGGFVNRTQLYRRVRAAGVRAGIEWTMGLHTFRHSAASIMWRRGVDVEKIRRTLGHHSWQFTSTTYVHLDDDDQVSGDVLADLVAGGGDDA
jgi:integrase